MAITLTVEGHEGIITRLQNLSNKVNSPEIVETLAKETSGLLAENTPRGRRGDSGLLGRTMTEVAGPEPAGDGWWAGVGNLAGIYPLEPAPKGTIKAFLEMIRGPKKIRRVTRLGGFRPKRKSRRSTKWPMAWWFLKEEEKVRLREMREAGVARVGGTSPYMPKYWFVQERGMGEVGIGPQEYIAKTVAAIRGRIGETITRVVRSTQ